MRLIAGPLHAVRVAVPALDDELTRWAGSLEAESALVCVDTGPPIVVHAIAGMKEAYALRAALRASCGADVDLRIV